MNFFALNKIVLLTMSILLSANIVAEESAQSTTVSANPSINYFKAVDVNQSSEEVKTQIKNIGLSDISIYSLSLFGKHSDQFQIQTDECSNQILIPSTSCDVGVKFSPTQRGNKQALLQIFSNSADTPTLQTFLTNSEDLSSEALRRLPPVLYSLQVPEVMVSGQTYKLKWSLLGYHDDYTSSLVMFDCSEVAEGACGDSYDNSGRIFSSFDIDGATVAKSKVSTTWNHNGVYASEFSYEVNFTPLFPEQKNVVVRFYQRSSNDASAGLGGLSLLIPGNLSSSYYDKEGRRVQIKIIPSAN